MYQGRKGSNALYGMGVANKLSSIKVKVYDVAEKKLIAEYGSLHEAAIKTGVNISTIKRLISSKGRSKINVFNKTICFR